ncbi:restriction endonuclease subunit S [Lactobacillus johnsonii]|uniref:restriction endonuclease subunit S n=1 Tax=Lactobacillus johnsonii TaxID=33959 RepID=UPI0029D77A56|nr:restriction endonuclease subunit S [Lactobacillus johnsonii]
MTKSDDKKVPALRFKGFTDDWEQRKLGEVLLVNSGKDYKNLNKGNIPVYGTGGYMLSVNRALSNENAIGIGRKGTIDRPQYLIAPFWTVDTLFFLTVKNQNDLKFFYALFQKINWKKYDESTGLPSLSKSTLNNIFLKNPNYKEQKKIGLLLSQIEVLITLQQRKLEQLNLLKKGLLQKIFSDNDFRPNLRFKNFNEKWKQHKLGSIVHWSKGNHLKKSTLNSKYDGYEVIHYADLYKFKPVLSKVIHWSRNNTGTIIPANSLLFPMSDVTPDGLARTTAMMKNGVRAGSDILIATVKNNNAEFLSYQINLYSKRIVPLVTGTTIRHINSKALSTLNIKIPTNSEQNIISKLFIFFENFVDLQQSKINQLKLLKKFILNNMFI